MDAPVSAAGRDTRLRPYTDATPKPLFEIDGGEPELTDALESLVADGRRDVGVELEGGHRTVNTPADLERAREYFDERASR